MKINRFIVTCLSLVAIVFSPTVVFGKSEEDVEKVSLQLQWKHQFEFAGFYAAKEKGYYAEAGLDIDIREYESDKDLVESVLSGETTFGTTYSTAIKARMEGKPIKLLASYFQRSPLALVTKPDIYFPRDLIGKKVMGFKDQFESTNFKLMFNQAGMSSDEFTVVPHTYSIDAFANGNVDAMTVFLTNEVYHLRQKKVPFNIIDPNNYGVPLYDVILYTNEDYAQKNPATVQSFIEATNRGWKYALEHQEEIVDLILSKYNTQNKTKDMLLYEADKTRRMVQPEMYPIGTIDPDRVKKIAQMFVSEGVAEKIVAPESYLFDSGNHETIRLSPQEKAFIKNHPVIRVSNEMDYPPFDFAIEGQPQGYTIDLLDLLAEKTGIKFEYVNGYTWAELVQLFREGKIDLLHSLVKTDERSKFMLFSDRIFRDRQMYITRKDNPDITDVSQLYGKTISQGKGWSTTELFQKNYPQIPLLIVDNLEKMLSAVAYGKVDATVADEAAATYLIKQKGMSDLKLTGWAREFDQFGGLNFHFAGQKDAPELISILNKARASLSVEELDRLTRKWFGESFGRTLTKEIAQTTTRKFPLSPVEQNYLKTKKEIIMCIDPDWEPYEMLDDNGNYIGLTADYFDLFQKMIPVPITLLKTKTWNESIQLAKARKCDILSLLSKSPERSQYLNFTKPYVHAKVVLVARDDVVYLDGLQSLSGKTLAIVKNYIYEEIVRTSYPNIKIIPVDNLSEGVQKVSDGSVYAAIGSLLTILPPIQKLGLSNLKIAGPANLQNDFRIGARNDEPELISIFDKAIKSIDQETENQILRRWYTVSVEESFDYSLLWKVSAAALLVLIVVLYWNRRLSTMTRKLNSAKDEAEAANKAKSQFLANMSHELRTPLNIILGFSQLMYRDHKASDEQRKNLKSIMQSGKHLLELINDVLELSKIEAGKTELYSESFDLHRLLGSLEGMFQLNAVQKGLTFEVSRGTDVPKYIQTDRSKLSQVLINLLTNAVKFTKQGSIRLDVQCKEQRDVPQNNTCHLHFSVSDTGIGISKKEQDKIFETFFQTESQAPEKTGTGLGLSISREFVALMGGNLTVRSSETKGSFFDFTIPVEITDQADQEPHSSTTRVIGLVSGQPTVRLLVAEDNQGSRDLLVTLLRSVGFEVKEAVNGREAIELWQEWQPHLIWMDLHMPEVDGIQAINEIRKRPGGDSTKIIALTAYAFEENKQHVLENGADDFLRKPFIEGDMFYLLEKHLGVQFQYADINNTLSDKRQSKPESPPDITSILQDLPDDMLDRFKNAITLGEIESINNIIDEIHKIDPDVGRFLKSLADEFAYDEIADYLNAHAVEKKN